MENNNGIFTEAYVMLRRYILGNALHMLHVYLRHTVYAIATDSMCMLCLCYLYNYL